MKIKYFLKEKIRGLIKFFFRCLGHQNIIDVVDEIKPEEGIEFELIQSERNFEPLNFENRVFNNNFKNTFTEFSGKIKHSCKIAVLYDAKVYGSESTVVTKSFNVPIDYSYCFRRKGKDLPIYVLNKLPNPVRLKGTVLILNSSGTNNYYHWLFDILPRIYLYYRRFDDFNKIDYILLNSVNFPFQIDTLELLNVPISKVINTYGEYKYIEADKVIAPSMPSSTSYTVDKFTCEFLRNLIPTKETKNNVRIFISREKANMRKIINEDELFFKLEEKYGFIKVFLEDLRIETQAQLFKDAEIVIGAHGAAFSNLVFCRPKTNVLEFYTNSWLTPSYSCISQLLNLNHYQMECSPENSIIWNNKSDSLVVDIVDVLEFCKLNLEG